MRYAIKYYMTPDEIADQIKGICNKISPCRGYTMGNYNGARRLDDIARMVDAMHEEIGQHEKLQLADSEQFGAVAQILEWDNYHTENIAFALAFGDAGQVFRALQHVHYMGQCHAIDSGSERPEVVY